MYPRKDTQKHNQIQELAKLPGQEFRFKKVLKSLFAWIKSLFGPEAETVHFDDTEDEESEENE